jgi:hypothetical protein
VVVETTTTTAATKGPAVNVLDSWIPWFLILVALVVGILAGYHVRKGEKKPPT